MSAVGSISVDTVTSFRAALRRQAAVLAWFDDWSLVGSEIDGAAEEVAFGEFLAGDCRRIPGTDGKLHWTLTDPVRLRTVRELGPEQLRDALHRSKVRPDDPVQRAFDRVIDPETAQPIEISREGHAADLQVVRWLTGVIPGLRSAAAMQAELGRFDLIEPLRRLTANGFFGRGPELARLAEHLREDNARPLVVSGIGGIGKSTLISKFVTDLLNSPSGLRFAYLNFDRGALAPNQPSRLLSEIIGQVALQTGGGPFEIQLLIEDLRQQEATDAQGSGRSSQNVAATVGTTLSTTLFTRASQFLRIASADGLLLVLDTFEEVQRQRITNLHVLWDLLRQLREAVPTTRTIISGRALDRTLGANLELDLLELKGLDPDAALHMVMGAPGLDVSLAVAERTIQMVSRNPLSLRLAIEILRTSDLDDPLLDLELQEGQIQGQLYERILLHIDDPEVKRMAHPGLAVRVVTPDVIRHVLAGPCEIDVPDDDAAQRLFNALEREATLVDVIGDALRHRNDVRALMLPTLHRDQKLQVNKIHRGAIKYYKRREGVASRAEELYHRLMLEQSEATLDKYWDPEALPSLRESLDEFPARGQVYLWSQSKGEISVDADVAREADDRSWGRATEALVIAELKADRTDVALSLVRERRGPHGESLLPRVEAEALEARREFDEALAILRTGRAASQRKRQAAETVALTLDVIRVLERMRLFDDAMTEAQSLRDALITGKGEAALDHLIATTSYLRLLRRSGQADSAEYAAAVADAVERALGLGRRALHSRRGLLRELLAEVGDASGELLSFGIETVGVARGVTDRLDSELRKVDSAVPAPRSAESSVPQPEPANSSLVLPAPMPPDFEPRSRTAERVAEYAEQSGPDIDLSEAIKESYQVETDALYS